MGKEVIDTPAKIHPVVSPGETHRSNPSHERYLAPAKSSGSVARWTHRLSSTGFRNILTAIP